MGGERRVAAQIKRYAAALLCRIHPLKTDGQHAKNRRTIREKEWEGI